MEVNYNTELSKIEASQYATKMLQMADTIWEYYVKDQQAQNADWLTNNEVKDLIYDSFRHDVARRAFGSRQITDEKEIAQLVGHSSEEIESRTKNINSIYPKKSAIPNRINNLGNYILDPNRIPWEGCRQELIRSGLLIEKPEEPKKRWGQDLNITKKAEDTSTLRDIGKGAKPYEDGDEFGDKRD